MKSTLRKVLAGNVTINGSISPLTISVTHPINVAYAISPDAETFTAPDITVTNNTKVAVIATLESLKAASGGTLPSPTLTRPQKRGVRSISLIPRSTLRSALRRRAIPAGTAGTAHPPIGR